MDDGIPKEIRRNEFGITHSAFTELKVLWICACLIAREKVEN